MKSLVAEDDELARLLLHSILSRFGECHIAKNGKEAVDRVVQEMNSGRPYDIMCLDIIMPVLDGQKALKEIREVERLLGISELESLKVIMVTAMEDFNTIVQAFEEGHCEAYLTKPVKEAELLDHLRELNLIPNDDKDSQGRSA